MDTEQSRLKEAADLRDLFPVPPHRLPSGTPAQLRCMDAAHNGLKRCSRRELERLVQAVADEVNAEEPK